MPPYFFNQEAQIMAVLINPLFDKGTQFQSTSHRFYSLFRPIQRSSKKESDFAAYLLTPVIDFFVMDFAFILDACIQVVNAVASLLKAFYMWTIRQQQSSKLIDSATKNELNDFWFNVTALVSDLVAVICNFPLAVVGLLTRPIASLVEAVRSDGNQSTFSISFS
jgi:hypothetical protein